MLLIRLLMLPIVLPFLAIMAVLMLIIGGLSWLISGEAYTVSLYFREVK